MYKIQVVWIERPDADNLHPFQTSNTAECTYYNYEGEGLVIEVEHGGRRYFYPWHMIQYVAVDIIEE